MIKFLSIIPVIIFSVGCCEESLQECYLAKKAVAESTEKFSKLEREKSPDAIWWQQAMFEAVLWRGRACKLVKPE